MLPLRVSVDDEEWREDTSLNGMPVIVLASMALFVGDRGCSVFQTSCGNQLLSLAIAVVVEFSVAESECMCLHKCPCSPLHSRCDCIE